jgi:uncharacterized protein (DUF1810 family)
MTDTFDLQRFVDAQSFVIDEVTKELRAGRKRTHWMWFIFPQAEGLGSSPRAQRYAIRSHAEATAYLAHPLLGPRLVDCTQVVCAVKDRTIHDILGSPDDMKFKSSMTLFEAVSADSAFAAALAQFYGGERDQATLGILSRWQGTAGK